MFRFGTKGQRFALRSRSERRLWANFESSEATGWVTAGGDSGNVCEYLLSDDDAVELEEAAGTEFHSGRLYGCLGLDHDWFLGLTVRCRRDLRGPLFATSDFTTQ